MIYSPQELKKIRKLNNLTQKQLAELSGVSQSLIAKIESNLIDPAWSKIDRIFSALQKIEKKSQKTAMDVMQKKIISVVSDDTLKDVIKKMKQYEISQVIVMHGSQAIGIVSEEDVLRAIADGDNLDDKVHNIMKNPPPIITSDTIMDVIISLLRYYPIIIVQEKGHYKGIITKSDVLDSMYKF